MFDPATLTDDELLRAALEDPDFRRAGPAARELARRPGVELTGALDTLVRAMHGADIVVRRRAAQALAAFGELVAPVAAALVEASASPQWPAREAAVQALASLVAVSDEARRALVYRALHDRVAHVRAAAAASLAGTGPALPALKQALEHHFRRVRCRALQALVRFEAERESLLPLFERALTDSHARVRRTAAETLGECGLGAMPALPALLRRQRDGDPRVRLAATEALTRIQAMVS